MNLDKLKVESFTTSIENNNLATIKGGSGLHTGGIAVLNVVTVIAIASALAVGVAIGTAINNATKDDK